MRNILKALAVLVFSFTVTNWAIAGFPPVRIGGLLQALKTKFTLLFPNNSMLDRGGITAYIDTGNNSLLYDGDFEGASLASEWAVTNATATLVDTERVNGKQHLNLNVSAAIPSLSQDQNVTVGGAFVASCWIKNDQAGVEFCSRVDGVDNVCKPLASDGNWKKYNIQDITATSSTSFGLSVKSIVAITGDIKVDNCSVGFSDKGQFEDYDDMPVGTVIPFSGANIPQGYLVADGNCVAKSDYVALSNAIGEAHGACDSGAGVGSGFNLPDLRGKFIRGVDSGAGNDPERLTRTACNTGGNTGDNVGSCQGDQFKSHTHGGVYSVFYPSGVGSAAHRLHAMIGGTSTLNYNFIANGGTETRPKNVYMIYIIKAKGRDSSTNIAQTSLSPDKAGFLSFSFFDMAEGDGWLKADGRCVLKDAYPDYFRNVGTSFGECTITTTNDGMNLPDMRGYFPRVLDDMGTTAGDGGRDPDVRTLGSTQTEQLASHRHRLQGGAGLVGGGNTGYGASNNNSFSNNVYTEFTGGNETRPDNMALMAYVRMVDRDVVLGRFQQIENIKGDLDASTANELTARFTTNSSSTITLASSNYDWIASANIPSGRRYLINFNPGLFTEIPVCVATELDPDTAVVRTFKIAGITTSSIEFLVNLSDDQISQIHLHCSKQGADVNKSFQGAVINLSNQAIKCQTKYLSANVTSDGLMADLQFDNLVMGKKYNLNTRIRVSTNGQDNIAISYYFSGTTKIIAYPTIGSSSGTNPSSESNVIFTATGTTLLANAQSLNAGSSIEGLGGTDNERIGSWSRLCELPDNYIDTTEF